MEAAKKQRIRKVGETHLILTLLAGFWLAWPVALSANQYFLSFQIWMAFKTGCFFVLQPQTFLFVFGSNSEFLSQIFKTKGAAISLVVIYAISVPAWSFCCGWILVGLKDWLNHFPIFRKKLF